LIVTNVAIQPFNFKYSTSLAILKQRVVCHTMNFLDLIKRHWFLAGTMVAIFFAEIFPELGAKEGKIDLFLIIYNTFILLFGLYKKLLISE
jgi:hypothetical protein